MNGTCRDQFGFGGDQMQGRIVGQHGNSFIPHDLARVDGRGDDGRRVDFTEFPENAELKIGEAGTFASPATRTTYRNAADHTERQMRHGLKFDSLAMLEEAP